MITSPRLFPRSLPFGLSRGPAMPALAALLDRSIEQIADAAADARRYDRETIRRVSDVWDNNTFPLFWAASARSAGRRERRARAALAWMADFGETRRAWVAEQAAIAGYDIETLLPAATPTAPYRDHLGHVMAPYGRLTAEYVADLAADYDLPGATVHSLRVERAGARLTASLRLVVPRRFAVEERAAGAELDVHLDEVTEVVFGAADAHGGIRVEPSADGIAISTGAGARLRAANGSYHLDDRRWYLSAAGQCAEAVTPVRGSGPNPRRQPGGAIRAEATAAAYLVHTAMLEIRSVRYPRLADRAPVPVMCRALAGAGTAILAAASQRSARRRQAAYHALVHDWADRGGPAFARWAVRTLKERSIASELEAPPESAKPTSARPPEHWLPTNAVLAMASWTAAHDDHGTPRPASAVVQLALPPLPDRPAAAPWRLRALSCKEPEVFRLHSDAFQGEGELRQTGELNGASRLDLHDGALLVASRGAWGTGRA